jgi:transposase
MDSLDEAKLRDALDAVETKAAAVRLLVAISHQNGVSQTELADWLGVERKTIYNWLSRFRESPDDPVAAARDDDRSGRPTKLTGDALTTLLDRLQEPPQNSGYERPTWTPELVQQHVEEVHGVTYSRASCRRLLRDAGLVYRKPDPARDPEFVEDVPDGKRRWLPE